ncbi:MAG: hypothetical protein HeimC3_24130 [Candidatus Heimdallarchaeota archaeon LC_3]|nr:MAG: hypothetical protein HeimC3_24130 [Candidatus Heimdallarchaeota archaeon LC_3]
MLKILNQADEIKNVFTIDYLQDFISLIDNLIANSKSESDYRFLTISFASNLILLGEVLENSTLINKGKMMIDKYSMGVRIYVDSFVAKNLLEFSDPNQEKGFPYFQNMLISLKHLNRYGTDIEQSYNRRVLDLFWSYFINNNLIVFESDVKEDIIRYLDKCEEPTLWLFLSYYLIDKVDPSDILYYLDKSKDYYEPKIITNDILLHTRILRLIGKREEAKNLLTKEKTIPGSTINFNIYGYLEECLYLNLEEKSLEIINEDLFDKEWLLKEISYNKPFRTSNTNKMILFYDIPPEDVHTELWNKIKNKFRELILQEYRNYLHNDANNVDLHYLSPLIRSLTYANERDKAKMITNTMLGTLQITINKKMSEDVKTLLRFVKNLLTDRNPEKLTNIFRISQRKSDEGVNDLIRYYKALELKYSSLEENEKAAIMKYNLEQLFISDYLFKDKGRLDFNSLLIYYENLFTKFKNSLKSKNFSEAKVVMNQMINLVEKINIEGFMIINYYIWSLQELSKAW